MLHGGEDGVVGGEPAGGVEGHVDVDGDVVGVGDGDCGSGWRGFAGFDAACVARAVCCCCGDGDGEAADAVAGGGGEGAREVGGGCGVDDGAEGAGDETHGVSGVVVGSVE